MNRVKRENWIGQARRIEGLPEAATAPVTQPASESDAAAGSASIVDQLSSAVDAATDTVSSSATAGIAAVTAAATSAVTAAGELVDDPPAESPENLAPESLAPESNVSPIGGAAAAGRNVRGLRSVRSEALVGPTTIDSQSAGDDLKRIRGIGVLIEKRLRAMGFSSYEQIGSWTQSDVDRVNQQLDFRGRVERENWIEQARILAAGGQTDFSRRQERGEERGEERSED
jgi:predicted flap endonuclease-1-like 5' DNA nuclease